MSVLQAVVERITDIEDRLLDAMRSPAADRVATETPKGDVASFRGRRTCVLVTYRRDGTAVPSPVWFGAADGKLYIRTGGWKVKRIAADPHVRVVPSSFRGRPLAAPLEATARVVPASERERAEEAWGADFGLSQRLYHLTLGRIQRRISEYVEVTPLP
jgi:PPOX class probable F420-dependent enzyme